MKKAITVTTVFYMLCYIAMILGQLTKNGTMLTVAFYADFVGMVLCPIILAFTAMIVGMRDEEKHVIKLYPSAAAATGAAGLARGILFFAARGLAGFAAAMKFLVISFLLLTLWFVIFEATTRMLKKETKFNRNKKL